MERGEERVRKTGKEVIHLECRDTGRETIDLAGIEPPEQQAALEEGFEECEVI